METIKLSNGVNMPLLGYGVFLVAPEKCERCVSDALNVGYRLIDTAQAYFNESTVMICFLCRKCGFQMPGKKRPPRVLARVSVNSAPTISTCC